MAHMQQPQRPLAAVTGACSAIGYELALQLARHGYDLLAVAEDDDVVRLADDFAEHDCQVNALQLDLSTLEGMRAFVRAVQKDFRPLDALVINAGVGVSGEFARETPLDEELTLIELDVIGSVRLTKALLPTMLERRQGRVLLTSSKAALKPSPYEAVYAASKAFLLSFATSLHEELKNTGVTVTALLPGAGSGLGAGDPALAARYGFHAMMAGHALSAIEERASLPALEHTPMASAH